MSPVLPADWKALIPNPAGGQCDELDKAILQSPQADFLFQSYMFNSDGSISTAFATDLCTALGLIGCSGGGTTSSTTTSGTGTTTTTTTPAATADVFAVCSQSGTLDPNLLISLNLATGVVTPIGGPAALSVYYTLAQAGGLVGSPLYGLAINAPDIDLMTIDKVTGIESVVAASVITPSDGWSPNCMRFNSAGTLLYIESNDGRLFTMDPTTGAKVIVGSYACKISDMTFVSGVMYAVGTLNTDPFTEKLFTLNLANGVPTVIGDTTDAVRLTLANDILYAVASAQIEQIKRNGTVPPPLGTATPISTYDIVTYGILRGLANGS